MEVTNKQTKPSGDGNAMYSSSNIIQLVIPVLSSLAYYLHLPYIHATHQCQDTTYSSPPIQPSTGETLTTPRYCHRPTLLLFNQGKVRSGPITRHVPLSFSFSSTRMCNLHYVYASPSVKYTVKNPRCNPHRSQDAPSSIRNGTRSKLQTVLNKVFKTP
ncbi:hypothetical protein P171DRAFT_119492 [Karstenula rhodostoma CBS 690.94]|uniref:Uncharacterized protein n=1 Tax=Karstenula rhodostoma CBS 690.94 TaxID=1392251 RepID=A0A9P4PA73_9PLEO|nr:hypothetical protein P171DRAFT_119492 [Karstenula rhodostoma CBS 690.94]